MEMDILSKLSDEEILYLKKVINFGTTNPVENTFHKKSNCVEMDQYNNFYIKNKGSKNL